MSEKVLEEAAQLGARLLVPGCSESQQLPRSGSGECLRLAGFVGLQERTRQERLGVSRCLSVATGIFRAHWQSRGERIWAGVCKP